MHKVVIFTDPPEECEILLSCLKILFPKCEIQVQPKQTSCSVSLWLQNFPHLEIMAENSEYWERSSYK